MGAQVGYGLDDHWVGSEDGDILGRNAIEVVLTLRQG